MTEQIKTAKAHIGILSKKVKALSIEGELFCGSDGMHDVDALLVSGLSDTEAAALPEIMERERGVCEWGGGYLFTDCRYLMHGAVFEFCPSCGRRVRIK